MRIHRNTNRHSRQLLGTLAVMVALLTLTLAPQASAQSATTSGTGQLRHCIMQVSPLEKAEVTSKVTNFQCFATFAEAIYHASGGRVSLPDTISPAELTNSVLEQYSHRAEGATPYNEYVIGQNWKDSGFAGDTVTIYTGEAAMCNGYTYGTNYPSTWDNTISSSRALGNCSWLTQYEYVNFGGALINCGNNFTSCSSMGVMDNAASSWRAHD